MNPPECDECGELLEDGDTFVMVDGGTVHRTGTQHDAGGGLFHPGCATEYVDRVYRSER